MGDAHAGTIAIMIFTATKASDPWAWLTQSTAPWWATGVFALVTALVTWWLTQRTTTRERERQRLERVRAVGQEHAREALAALRQISEVAPDAQLSIALGHIRLIPDPDVRQIVGRIEAYEVMGSTRGWWDSDEKKPSHGMMQERFKQAAINALESWIREEPITEKDRNDLLGIANRAKGLDSATAPLGRPTEDWPVEDWAKGTF